MSANNIVVIKKEEDGKFRGYHRDYDAYCEGQYDEGPCHLCGGSGDNQTCDCCDACGGTGHYPSHIEISIFEADTIEGAIYAYSKWSQEVGFGVEYGYEFQGLEPNAETVEAMKEIDLMLVRDNLKFILDRIVNTGNKGTVLVNDLTPEMVREKVGEALDLLNNPLQIVKEVESVEELMEELHKPDDTELLDFLQQELDKAEYTGRVVCRKSTTGRGWRLLESSHDDTVSDIRQAIINYMEQVKKGK